MWLTLAIVLCVQQLRLSEGRWMGGCQRATEFRCESGQCVDGGRYCDGNHDCYDGTDEPERCTNCNRTFYGLVDEKYPLRLSEHRSASCTFNFEATGGKNGDRLEITFLSFHIGAYDLESSSCIYGYMELKDGTNLKNRRSTLKKKKEIIKSSIGSFCGALVGKSATFYSTGNNVKLTIFVPPQGGAGHAVAPRLYLTYRFLRKAERNKVRSDGCDVVLTDCYLKHCVLRSPNYPGFYLRNLTCFYWIKQQISPHGKTTQIEIDQPNEFKIKIPSGRTTNDKRGTLTSDCNGDTIRIYDGNSVESPLLAKLCGAGPMPAIRSSGPDMLVQLVSIASQPLTNSHFEIDVRVSFKDGHEDATTNGCSVTINGTKNPVGVLKAPSHSLPSGTTCTYRVIANNPTDRVWYYFTSYHITDLHSWSDDERCDVGKLEIIHTMPRLRHSHHHHHHGDLEGAPDVETFCEKTPPKQCGHASDFLDLIPSRPCAMPEESYLTPGPELILNMSYLAPLTVRESEPFFEARYEVVEGISSECFVAISSKNSPSGVIESPTNVFLYGRGGSKDLSCKYLLEGSMDQKVLVTIEDISFSQTQKHCTTTFEPMQQRQNCNITLSETYAAINVTELWQDFVILVGCVCEPNIHLTLETVGRIAQIEFIIRNMGPRDDFRTFSFRLRFQFLPASSVCHKLTSVLSGSHGHFALTSQLSTPLRCRWLLAAMPPRALYVTVRGKSVTTDICNNKIVFISVVNSEPYVAFCGASSDHIYESFFTEAWKPASSLNPDLTFVEFIFSVPGVLQFSWIEVMHSNPKIPCSTECPELEACLAEGLACDGVNHCPVTGNDESPEKCASFPFPLVILASATGAALATLLFLVLVVKRRMTISTSKTIIPPPEMYRNDCKQSTLNMQAR